MYACEMHECTCVEVRGKLRELILSFHHVGSADQTQVVSLGGKCSHLVSHLASHKGPLAYCGSPLWMDCCSGGRSQALIWPLQSFLYDLTLLPSTLGWRSRCLLSGGALFMSDFPASRDIRNNIINKIPSLWYFVTVEWNELWWSSTRKSLLILEPRFPSESLPPELQTWHSSYSPRQSLSLNLEWSWWPARSRNPPVCLAYPWGHSSQPHLASRGCREFELRASCFYGKLSQSLSHLPCP